MNDLSIILTTQAAIAVILFFVIKTYFTGYYKKKGENKALSEDVKKLTRQVEEVKSRFDFLSSSKFDRYSRELNSHEQLVEALERLKTQIVLYQPRKYRPNLTVDDINTDFMKIQEAVNNITSLASKIKLYTLNDKLLKVFKNLYDENVQHLEQMNHLITLILVETELGINVVSEEEFRVKVDNLYSRLNDLLETFVHSVAKLNNDYVNEVKRSILQSSI